MFVWIDALPRGVESVKIWRGGKALHDEWIDDDYPLITTNDRMWLLDVGIAIGN